MLPDKNGVIFRMYLEDLMSQLKICVLYSLYSWLCFNNLWMELKVDLYFWIIVIWLYYFETDFVVINVIMLKNWQDRPRKTSTIRKLVWPKKHWFYRMFWENLWKSIVCKWMEVRIFFQDLKLEIHISVNWIAVHTCFIQEFLRMIWCSK